MKNEEAIIKLMDLLYGEEPIDPAVRAALLQEHPELAQELDRNKIGNRMLFGGNLVRQPAFVRLRQDDPDALRISGELTGADRIMNHTLFLGTYPGLSSAMIDFTVKVIRDFAGSKS